MTNHHDRRAANWQRRHQPAPADAAASASAKQTAPQLDRGRVETLMMGPMLLAIRSHYLDGTGPDRTKVLEVLQALAAVAGTVIAGADPSAIDWFVAALTEAYRDAARGHGHPAGRALTAPASKASAPAGGPPTARAAERLRLLAWACGSTANDALAGEIAGLAGDSVTLCPWIGFDTYGAHRRALWLEGYARGRARFLAAIAAIEMRRDLAAAGQAELPLG